MIMTIILLSKNLHEFKIRLKKGVHIFFLINLLLELN